MLNKKFVFIGIGVIILLGVIGGGYYWWTGTPEYSVSQIKKAIKTHNSELGLKYIDTDAIFENLWTDMKSEVMKKTEKTEGFELFSIVLGDQLVENMKPALKEQIKQEIGSWFSGSTEEKSKEAISTKEDLELGTFWQQKDLKIRRQGNFAYIELLNNVKLIFTKKEGKRYWAISKIEGFSNNLVFNETEEKINSATESKKMEVENKTTTSSKMATTPLPKSDNTSFPKSEPVSPVPTSAMPTRIDGLASISVDMGIWENWDADIENDGPFISIVYLDANGDNISNDSTKNMPISADVKLYTKDMSDAYNTKKGRLVFSAHYSNNQIITHWGIYRKIRIPKEEIRVNPDVDYQYGYASVIIHTPEQGNFADEMDNVVLYEK